MMTSSNGNIFRVTGPLCGEFTGPGEFPTQRPVTRSFGVFFDPLLNKRLSKQPWGWWFETPSWSLWRQCNVLVIYASVFCLLLLLRGSCNDITRTYQLHVKTTTSDVYTSVKKLKRTHLLMTSHSPVLFYTYMFAFYVWRKLFVIVFVNVVVNVIIIIIRGVTINRKIVSQVLTIRVSYRGCLNRYKRYLL